MDSVNEEKKKVNTDSWPKCPLCGEKMTPAAAMLGEDCPNCFKKEHAKFLRSLGQ